MGEGKREWYVQSLEVGKVQPGRRVGSGVASAFCQQSLESLTYKCSSVGESPLSVYRAHHGLKPASQTLLQQPLGPHPLLQPPHPHTHMHIHTHPTPPPDTSFPALALMWLRERSPCLSVWPPQSLSHSPLFFSYRWLTPVVVIYVGFTASPCPGQAAPQGRL